MGCAISHFYVAFTIVLRYQIKDFSLFLLSALFPWTWFSNSISASTVSLIANRTLIKKFPFPKYFLLTAGVISQGIHFLFSLPIIACLVYYYGKTAGANWLIGIPVLLIIQFFITLGASLAVSAPRGMHVTVDHRVRSMVPPPNTRSPE